MLKQRNHLEIFVCVRGCRGVGDSCIDCCYNSQAAGPNSYYRCNTHSNGAGNCGHGAACIAPDTALAGAAVFPTGTANGLKDVTCHTIYNKQCSSHAGLVMNQLIETSLPLELIE
ncbi:unnamed protein product, partial [Rotaria sordida]